MTNQKGFVVVIMIWITVLTIWAVNNMTSTLSYLNSVNVSGIPHYPADQPISTVRMNENTVWIINANSNHIRVITQEEDGFKITGSEMQYEQR